MKETKDRYVVVVTENQFSRDDLIQDHERHINEGYLNNPGVSNVRLGSLHIYTDLPRDILRAEQSLLFTEDITASSGPTPEEIEQQEAPISLLPNQCIYVGFGNTQQEALQDLMSQICGWASIPLFTYLSENEGSRWKVTQIITRNQEHSNG